MCCSSSLLSEQVLMVVVRAVLTLFLGSPVHHHPVGGSDRPHANLAEGTFTLGPTHNFDAYLAELGVNILLRNLASLANPTVTISR